MDIPSNTSPGPVSLKQELRSALAAELARHTKELPEHIARKLQTPKNPEHGDISYPAFEFAKGAGLPPPVAAEKLRESLSLPEGIESASTAGPFLNFKIQRSAFTAAALARRIKRPDHSGTKIILEYSSPNIAKPFHVGHLRATVIGNALDRIYRFLGYDVVSINHLGDWGTQFGFVWAGCEIWGEPKEATVGVLVDLYRKATSLKAAQAEGKVELDSNGAPYPDINEMARGYFRDLEEGKEAAVKFWKWCLKISMAYFKKTYKRLNVDFDHYTGESFYSDKLAAVRKLLEASEALVESKGALGVDLGEEIGFARVLTPDGRSLYLTRDIATAKYRADTFRFDRALYVVGAPQTLHFQQLKGVLKAIGALYADDLIHVPFGSVLGMKTRGDGEFVELNDFIDEAAARALSAYHDAVAKRPADVDEKDVADAVGLAALLFSTLHRQRMKDVQFSWEHALAFSGDSGPYLLYAVARINGIEERARESGIEAAKTVAAADFPELEAYRLALQLDDFYPTLERVVEDNEPSYLAAYALELAFAFSKAYQVLRVLGEESNLAGARLALFRRTKDVLKEALELLGLKVIERM